MADYRKHVVVTTTVIYKLDSPANWIDVNKVLAVIQQEYPTKLDYDDTVKVLAYDDEIHFVIEVESVVKNA